MREVWKPVVGYEGYYEVSNQGRVRSLDRVDTSGKRRRGKNLKPRLCRAGYVYFGLRRANQQHNKYAHRLVAEAFIGPCPPNEEVRHGPDGRSNNSVKNLCYGTRSDNRRDCVRDGTDNKGSRHGLSKLTDNAVRDIRQSCKNRGDQRRAARKYDVSESLISMVINRKVWLHI